MTQPKTIEEKRDPIIEILEAVYLHGRLTPEQSYGLPEGQMTIEEATKAIVEIVEEEKTNPPTPPEDKAKCDCACHKMHAGPCENCWFCITSAQPDKAKCEHEWDGVNSKLWYCKKCGEEFTEANPPQPDMEEMKDGICEILDDLPTSVSEKRIQHFSSAILDFLLANYSINKLKNI